MTNEKPVLGESSARITLNTEEAVREVSVQMASQARHHLKVFSHDLESMLYDNDAFCKQVARVATLQRHSSVEILLKDPVPAIKGGHRLIELSQRLSSYVHIRRVSRDFMDSSEAFLIADAQGVVFRPHGERFGGWGSYNAGPAAAKWVSFFASAWVLAEPEKEFRRLHL